MGIKPSPILESELVRFLMVAGDLPKNLLIVDKARLESLVRSLTTETVQGFLHERLSNTPNPTDPAFAGWVKRVRTQLGHSQRTFAQLIREKGYANIYGSDIGNIETGKRVKDYRPDRLEMIRTAIQRVLAEHQSR